VAPPASIAVQVDLFFIVFCSLVVPSVNAVPVLKAYSLIVIVTDVVPLVEESAPETLDIETVAVSLPSFTVSSVGLNVAVPVVCPAVIVISDIFP